MATNTRRAGIATWTINGVPFDVKGGLKYSTAQSSRETMKGQSGIPGFKEMPQVCYIEGTVYDDYSLTLSDFVAMTDVTNVVQHANGKSIAGSSMWWAGDGLENDTEEGTFMLRFEGALVEEST